MTDATPVMDGRKEACKTYLEQTKLLVTLSSAFLFAPATLVVVLKDRRAAGLTYYDVGWFIAGEAFFVVSVLLGYVALGSLAGSQDSGKFDVYRQATRYASLAQFAFYVLGLCVFIGLAVRLIT